MQEDNKEIELTSESDMLAQEIIEEEVELSEEESLDTEEETVEEVIEDNSEPKTQTNQKASGEAIEKHKNQILFDGRVSFRVRIALALILFILAIIAIKPTDTASFYKLYYVLFILFSLGVISCCCIAQYDITQLWNFYKGFKESRGRKEDLISNNKNLNEISHAYTESFLLNETYNKTRSNADLYFGGETYFNDMNKLPIQSFLKIIPGTFIQFTNYLRQKL